MRQSAHSLRGRVPLARSFLLKAYPTKPGVFFARKPPQTRSDWLGWCGRWDLNPHGLAATGSQGHLTRFRGVAPGSIPELPGVSATPLQNR